MVERVERSLTLPKVGLTTVNFESWLFNCRKEPWNLWNRKVGGHTAGVDVLGEE